MPGRFKNGDKVYCKIRGNSIVAANTNPFDAQLIFEIIGRDEYNGRYVILIPKYFSIKNSWNIIEEHIAKFNISPNHLDSKAITILEDRVVRIAVSTLDGMFCCNCEEFFPMAEPNQEDGTLRCWSCRSNRWR